jgi:hypothetical protein
MRNNTIGEFTALRWLPQEFHEIELSSLGGTELPAYRHPLGFIHVAIHTQSIRIHIWPLLNRLQSQDESLEYHNHTFGFTSYVLCGAIEDHSVEVTDDELATQQIYEVTYGDGNSVLHPTGRLVRLSEPQRRITRAGGNYEVPALAFHRSKAEAGTITILAVTPTSESRPHVVGPVDVPQSIEFVRQRCSKETVQAELNAILRLRLGSHTHE